MQSKLPAVFASLEKENRRERISDHAACGLKVEQSRRWVVHRIKLWLLTAKRLSDLSAGQIRQVSCVQGKNPRTFCFKLTELSRRDKITGDGC